MSTDTASNFGVTLTGSPSAVAAAKAALAAVSCGGACAPTNGNGNGGGSATPVPVSPSGGALASQSMCLTTGQAVRMCDPGTFPPYTAQAPLFVSHTPTGNVFNVPCAVAVTFFGEVGIKCRSTNSIVASVTIGDPGSGCSGTQYTTSANGSSADIVMNAPAGCEEFAPGILFTVGMSANTSPGPVNIDVDIIGSDGCPVTSMHGIRVMLTPNGGGLTAGTLALIFNCIEEQRLYPVLARLRTSVVQIPAGTTLPGGVVPAPGILFVDETIAIHITGPAGTTITAETLAWNHPTLSCLWNNALRPLGL